MYDSIPSLMLNPSARSPNAVNEERTMTVNPIRTRSERTVATSSRHLVKSHFSARTTEWAACYADPEPGFGTQNLISRQRFALEMVEATIPPSSTILDVGCGSGVMAAKLRERGHTVWGIDFAEPMIRHARQLCDSDLFVVGDAQDLPFPDNTFDAAVSLGVMQFVDSDEQALREIWRVLRPGGKAVIAIPSGSSPLQRADRVVLSAYYLVKHVLRGRPAPSPQSPARIVDRRYYRRRWLGLLRGLRYEPEEWICHGWGWFRSPLSLLVQRLSMGGAVLRRGLERLFGEEVLSRACNTFVRSRALNWLAAEHIVRVRAIKDHTAWA